MTYNKKKCVLNETREHYSKWNMPVAEGQIFYDYTYVKNPNKSNSQQRVEW